MPPVSDVGDQQTGLVRRLAARTLAEMDGDHRDAAAAVATVVADTDRDVPRGVEAAAAVLVEAELRQLQREHIQTFRQQ
jgi:hypothetical protein